MAIDCDADEARTVAFTAAPWAGVSEAGGYNEPRVRGPYSKVAQVFPMLLAGKHDES